ncbi:transcriptional regulator, XRE family with cupin sensor [Pseudomonas asplenii]|uniref:Transcriptional regulator, XRE family with cupin sensor n=2 Tax=Pseudomonas asplenii TaxID=53407 RepID=A0A1H6PAS2_9PSED|nr:transcriptional regulator, XRE family with cupin sensor [Pseudomonas fuscovaginae]
MALPSLLTRVASTAIAAFPLYIWETRFHRGNNPPPNGQPDALSHIPGANLKLSNGNRAQPMNMPDEQPPKLKLEQYLGIQIKRQRQAQELKLADVARIAGISQGMLSKIENAQVSTSLDILSRLCDVLGMPMSKLFSQYDQQGGSALLVKHDEGLEVVRRGTEKGHTYHLLNHTRGPKKSFEAYMVSMDDASEEFPTFSHPGTEFLHLLEGELVYRHGNQLYAMKAGDSLTFDGEIPHGPEKLVQVPIRLLSIMNYGASGE